MIQRLLKRVLNVAVALLFLVTVASIANAGELSLLPSRVTLESTRASQRFIVGEKTDAGVVVADRSEAAQFTISNPNIAQVSEDGIVTPVADGVTTLQATYNGMTSSALIKVRSQNQSEPWTFRNHVLPVLTKAGCNQGSCHGAAAGKNGFRLTLRGYGPEVDYDVLTRQAKARRIIKTRPQESLMLLKATAAVEHGGGIRFGTDSLEYQIIAEWIGAGMPAPSPSDARIERVEAFPQLLELEPGATQQILVQATYSDGSNADVTRWAKFGTTDETVATVSDSGKLTVVGSGEGAITVWFDSLVDLATVTVPYPQEVESALFAKAVRYNEIDNLNLDKLESLRIPPSPICDDATFLRRAYLDLTGSLPSVPTVDAFLNDSDPEKRSKLVDRLLDSEKYVDYWSYKWSDLFLVSSKNLAKPVMWSFYRFIRASVSENRPWDEFAREILTAKGNSLENGPANYFAIHRDPIELAENASMAFLGLSLTCARCHNHPMEKWTQDEYYGFANLFGRVKLKDGDQGLGDVAVIPASTGEIIHPRRGVPMPPKPLDAAPIPLDETGDRREVLADWMKSPENPYFSAAIVNRVWANFFGRGLVDPEDDLRATNPPSDRDLMDWLVADFRENHFDVQHLIRTIMNSAAYQRSSVPVPGNTNDSKFLSHYTPKRLPAEVLLDAISTVTGVSSSFSGYPEDWRALQLPDVQVSNNFLDSFGRPVRNDTCSCERSEEPSLAQALQLANGSTLNEKLRDESGSVAAIAKSDRPFEEVLDHLFKAALSRGPTESEMSRLLGLLDSSIADAAPSSEDERGKARRAAIEDVYWAILTGNEFLFNH